MFAFSHSFSSSYYPLSPKKSPILSESFSKFHSNLELSKHFAQRDGISDSRLPEKRRMYPRFQSKIPCRTGKGAFFSLLQQRIFRQPATGQKKAPAGNWLPAGTCLSFNAARS
jgi:hypothetical protein